MIDEVAAAIAAQQHGVVTRQQLLREGVSSRAIEGRLARGRFHRLHRGVYGVGPVSPPRAAEMAAVLACGPAAAVSDRSAAALWGIARPRAPGSPVEVLVCGHSRQRPGLRVRRTDHVHPGEVGRLDRIPITSPARTLYDLARSGRRRLVERALAHAFREELTTRDELAALLARYPRRRGTRSLRTILGGPPIQLTRSEAEDRFLELVRSAALPEPAVNVRIGRHEVDFYWPERRVVVETDGFEHHSSRSAFERDRERDGELARRGIRVLRITWRQLTDQREVVLVTLAQTLGPE